MISVIVADDHNLVREGIVALLNREQDISVVAQAGDGRTAVALAQQVTPDVLVMDIAMPLMNGIQAVQRLRSLHCSTQVVILSMYSDRTLVRQALRSGARGYLLKSAISDELLLATRAANRGDVYLSPAISRTVLDGYLDSAEECGDSLYERLTPRELEVLQLVAEGFTTASIALQLGIAEKTVEKHRSNLMQTLDAHDLATLIRVAIRNNLVFLDQ